MRVLAENLTHLTGATIARYPWLAPTSPDVQLTVELARFEPVEGKQIELDATVKAFDFSKNSSAIRRHEIAVPLAKDDGAGIAAAMSAALAELARRIAAGG